MRVLISIVLILVVIGVFGFLMTNLDSRVNSITVWTTEYRDVLTFYVVVISVIVGFAFTAVIAIVEGARQRLENRRLKRQIQTLETEINYLRTQPRSAARPEPDALERQELESPPVSRRADSAASLPTAPVYGLEDEDESPGTDDDAYSGGTAV